jgi:hypothetical protein
MKNTSLIALIIILMMFSAKAQTISFYEAPAFVLSGAQVANVGSTTVTLSQPSAIQIILDSNYTVTGLGKYLREIVNVVITDSSNNTVGNFTGESQEIVTLVGDATGVTVVSGTTSTVPAGTYTLNIFLSTNSQGAPTYTANFDTTIIATQGVNPGVQSAIDAATAAFQAGQTSLANQLADLVNTVSGLQTQLASQQSQLGDLQTQVSALSSTSSTPAPGPTDTSSGTPTDSSGMQGTLAGLQSQLNALTDQTNSELNDLRNQVGQKQDQQSFLLRYVLPIGGGAALGIGGSTAIGLVLLPPSDSSSDSKSTPQPGARPGYYDR